MRRSLLVFVTVTTICFSCKNDKTKAGEDVEFYLLTTYQTVTAKCQIDPSVSILQDTPIIKNYEILAYSKTDYKFKLTEAAIQKVKTFIDTTPFAVTVDKQVIYYGFFKPSYSSSSCDHSITMDLDWTSGNKFTIKLGYPSALPGVTVDDKRNDPKLIETLKQQGKLK